MTPELIVAISTLVGTLANAIALIFHINTTTPPTSNGPVLPLGKHVP